MLDCGPVAPAVMAAGYACTMPGVIKLPPRIDRPYSFAYRPLILTFRPRRRPATFPMSSAPYTSCSTTSQKLHPLTWPTIRLTMKIGWSSIGRPTQISGDLGPTAVQTAVAGLTTSLYDWLAADPDNEVRGQNDETRREESPGAHDYKSTGSSSRTSLNLAAPG